jgi:hypothetical protein
MNESEKQFSFTPAASSTSGRTRKQFLISPRRGFRCRALLLVLCVSASAQADSLPITEGLTLRLGADTGITTNASGKITDWQDQSGAGHSATQSSSSYQPALAAGVLNGLPAARFSGAQYMSLSGQVLTSQVFSIMVVTRDVSTSTSYRELFSNWDSVNGGTSVFFGTTAQSPVRARFTDDFGGAATGQTGVGTVTNPGTPFIFSAVSGSNHVAVYQNTGAISNRLSALAPRTLTANYVIGRQGSLNGEYWSGDIAEMLVYNRELGSDELASVWQFLMAKYLPSQLPPRILSISNLQNQAAITFQMARQTNYYVEAISSLSDTHWTTLSQFTNPASLSNVTVLDPMTNAQRFYRLRLGP